LASSSCGLRSKVQIDAKRKFLANSHRVLE
jgi:hypothetical protein